MPRRGAGEEGEGEAGYKSVLDFGRGARVYPPHDYGGYPTKLLPQAVRVFVKRFSNPGDTILDPFCGSGTVAVEAKLNCRNSISYDVNPGAVELTREKLGRANPLTCPPTRHVVEVGDARSLPLPGGSVDSIITDPPYDGMVRYSDLPGDLSNLDYESFLAEVERAFKEMHRVLKYDRYCVVFACDYRVAAARKILPVHADFIQIARGAGFTLFDIYVWRYYRSGEYRPLGRRPYQAMGTHAYILVFHKGEELERENAPARHRRRLAEKLEELRHATSKDRPRGEEKAGARGEAAAARPESGGVARPAPSKPAVRGRAEAKSARRLTDFLR